MKHWRRSNQVFELTRIYVFSYYKFDIFVVVVCMYRVDAFGVYITAANSGTRANIRNMHIRGGCCHVAPM